MKQRKKYLYPIQYYKDLSVTARAGLWFLVCSVFQKGTAAITTPVFTRLLNKSEYGQVSVYYSWVDILGIFITFGLPSAVYARGLVQNSGNKERYTSIMVGLSIATTIGSFIVYMVFHNGLNSVLGIGTGAVVSVFVYVLFHSGIEFWYQEKRVTYNYKPFIALTIFMTVMRPAAAIAALCLFPHYKIIARIIPDVAITGIVGMVLIVFLLKRGKCIYDRAIWKESMLFVLPLIPHYLSQRVLSQSDRIMISNMAGDGQAGIYSLAYQIGMMLNLLSSALDSTVSPWAFRKIKEGKYRDVGKLGESLVVLFGLCVLCFSLIAPELTRLFAAKEYYDAVYIIPVVSLSSFFMFLYLQFVYFEYYSGKTQFVMIATIVSAVINLALNYICIPRYGYMAAAYTTLVCYICYAAGHYFIMRFLCRTHYHTQRVFHPGKLILASILVSAGAFGVIHLYAYPWLRWLAAFGMILITMLYAVRFLKRYGQEK